MSGLFVSKEHKRQTVLRTHRAYHCVVYSVLSLVLIQIPLGLLLLAEKNAEAALNQRKSEATEVQNQLAARAEPLNELRRKIEEAQRWSEVRDHRMAVTEILSKLEYSVSDGICFTEITVHNRALRPRDPDRFEVEVRGFAKALEHEAWQRAVEPLFPEWTVSAPRVSKLLSAGAPEGTVPFGLVLRQAVNSSNKRKSK
jgi:hypothetical protein